MCVCVCVCVHVCMMYDTDHCHRHLNSLRCVCVCVCVCFHIMLYVNCFGRTVLDMCMEYHIWVNMCCVSTQGVDKRMLNVYFLLRTLQMKLLARQLVCRS